jgi:molybdate transport system permease protein
MILDALRLSLIVATLTTVIVGIIGIWLGRWLSRGGGLRETIDAVVSVPLVLPPTVTGFLLITLVGRNGILGKPLAGYLGLEISFTPAACVLAAAVVSLPLMVRASRAAFESLDPHDVRLAATLGHTPWSVFRHVELPLARRGLAAGAALTFGRALGEFGATLMLAGNLQGRTQTLPLAVYEAFLRGEDRTAWGIVLILSALSVLVLLLSRRLGGART